MFLHQYFISCLFNNKETSPGRSLESCHCITDTNTTNSLMKLNTYETWQVITKKKSLCNVICRFTLPSLLPCQHFFVLAKLVGNYSHSSALLLRCQLHRPKGQVYSLQWSTEIPIQQQGGPTDELKSYPRPEAPKALHLCILSPAGLHWSAGWRSEETTGAVTSICHTEKTRASPLCSRCASPS